MSVFACCGGCQWPISARESCGDPSLYLSLTVVSAGGTGEDSDGSLLSLAAEAMLGVFSGGVSRVEYLRLYVGLSDVGQNF